MSASAVFEFDTKSDVRKVLKKLVEAWKPGNGVRSLSLYHQADPQLRYDFPASNQNVQEQLDQFIATIKPLVDSLAASLKKEFESKVSQVIPVNLPGSYDESLRKFWRCSIDYYFYSEQDRKDFEEVAKVILSFAEGDVIYYADPDVGDEGAERVLITVDDILKHEPNMSDGNKYVVRAK